ncbi:MAG: monovalent cation/H(+) antiporter subunit G [Methanoregulaceae archaeon]|jgi:multicomponent Na+:H+ antiporter subunit G|nr:monovalent cation/H(+) antiporter subunit G [Methanoregulaceae archaeon]MCC7468322.1 monovalent cation/H(+) antiporter subunit G [Burkholderiaceae bacterium]NLH25965.1 cation:proton antiporter [Methanomicrobiales archaeon]HMZ31255.1 monovalent cation/H(+) antiporter subunit G [Methanoregulaceae archaeon]HNJ81524.1 monovalent cation/H(+) antiporter subunit G [Methanoregulaceae archaeon]
MIAELLIIICLAIGIIFNSLGVIGLLRFPDLYTRMHATTKATTFGSVFTTLAVIVYSISLYLSTIDSQFIVLGVHAFIAAFALAFTNAIGSHAIARAAHRSGIMPSPAVVDRLKEAGR